MKNLLLAVFLLLSFINASAQSAANTWSVKFSDAIVGRYQPTINTMTAKGWEYSNGIILVGMEKVYEKMPSPNVAYLNYIQAYVDAYVNGSGVVASKIMSTLGLDGVHPGLLCVFLYQKTGLLKYKLAAQNLRDTVMLASIGYPKTPDGGYWHRNDATNFKNVELLDGIYMAQPFLAKYGSVFNDNAALDTAVNQTILLYSHLYSNTTKLVKHAWDYDKNTYPWAVPATGISTQVWSRGMGWFVMSIIEILRYLPSSHPKHAQLVTMLNNLAMGISNYQDAAGLWYDVVDSSATATNNYIETSGSAMFIYALKSGIDSGWLNSATYTPVVNKAWTQYKTYITTYGGSINGYAGGPQITSFCPAMGVQNNYTAYVANRPVSVPTASGKQHPHGYAATLMAASAMEFPLIRLPLNFISFTAKTNAHSTVLSWQTGDDNEADHYEVQKANNPMELTSIASIIADGSGSYTWVDNAQNSNTVYYRIKAVSKNGEVHYSEILHLELKTSTPGFLVSPNPVKNGCINLFFANFKSGKYVAKIINGNGNVVMVKSIDIFSGTSVLTISLPAAYSQGLYYLQLNGEGSTINKSIIVK